MVTGQPAPSCTLSRRFFWQQSAGLQFRISGGTFSGWQRALALAVVFHEQISGGCGLEVGSSWLWCELSLLQVATGLALATNLNLHEPWEHDLPHPGDSLRLPPYSTLVATRLIQWLSLTSSWQATSGLGVP